MKKLIDQLEVSLSNLRVAMFTGDNSSVDKDIAAAKEILGTIASNADAKKFSNYDKFASELPKLLDEYKSDAKKAYDEMMIVLTAFKRQVVEQGAGDSRCKNHI